MTTALMQTFNIRLADNARLPATTETTTGIVNFAPDFWVKFETR